MDEIGTDRDQFSQESSILCDFKLLMPAVNSEEC